MNAYWIGMLIFSLFATLANLALFIYFARKKNRPKQDSITMVFSLGAVLMSAAFLFSFTSKFASKCSQKTDQISPRDCLLTNPHLFIYPFADYVIMLTSFLSSVDCFWTVSCQRRKALFNEKNINWIFAAVGIAAVGSVLGYTLDVLQRKKEKIQACCLNNLMSSETFIFCYYVVTLSISLMGAVLLVLSALVYAICYRSKNAEIRRAQTRRYKTVFTQATLLVLLSFFSQTLQAIGGLTLLNNRAGDWFFQTIWLLTIGSYIVFAIYKAARDHVLQRKIRSIFNAASRNTVHDLTTAVQNTKI